MPKITAMSVDDDGQIGCYESMSDCQAFAPLQSYMFSKGQDGQLWRYIGNGVRHQHEEVTPEFVFQKMIPAEDRDRLGHTSRAQMPWCQSAWKPSFTAQKAPELRATGLYDRVHRSANKFYIYVTYHILVVAVFKHTRDNSVIATDGRWAVRPSQEYNARHTVVEDFANMNGLFRLNTVDPFLYQFDWMARCSPFTQVKLDKLKGDQI